MFALIPFYMLGINTRKVCHDLAIDRTVKPMSQRKCKVSEEKRATIDEEVKLRKGGIITEVKYPS